MYIKEKSARTYLIENSGKSIETPFFVPAISSTKANWPISGYIDLIQNIGYPGFLVSAYDFYQLEKETREHLEKMLSKDSNKRIFLFLDNGNYEAYWYKDQTWTSKKLESVLAKIHPDFCFSFDIFWEKETNVEKHIKETITSIARTAGMQKSGSTIALFHSNTKLFPKNIRKVVDYINPEIVAIPERELGFSIFERAQTIKNIRIELDEIKKPIPIHILGAGNPVSILVYTLCGADMYDALDWSSTFIDPRTGQLLHFSHKDLVNCGCKACRMKKVPYNYQVMTHNLIFYGEFLDKIKGSIQNEEIDWILNEYLHEKNVSQVKKIAGLT